MLYTESPKVVKGDLNEELTPGDLVPTKILAVALGGLSMGAHPLHNIIQRPVMMAYVKATFPCLVNKVERGAIMLSRYFIRHHAQFTDESVMEYVKKDPGASKLFASWDDQRLLILITRAQRSGQFVPIRHRKLNESTDGGKYTLGFNTCERLITLAFDAASGEFRPAGFKLGSCSLGDYLTDRQLRRAEWVPNVESANKFWQFNHGVLTTLRSHAKELVVEGATVVDVRYSLNANSRVTAEYGAQAAYNNHPIYGEGAPTVPRSAFRYYNGEPCSVSFRDVSVALSYDSILEGLCGASVKLFQGRTAVDPMLFPTGRPELWPPL